MSGQTNCYCFDTNVLIGLFSGSIDYRLIEAEEIIISIISEIEYLSFDKLKHSEKETFNKFKKAIKVIYLDEFSEDLQKKIIEIRKTNKLKLPDAIIAASAIIHNATLITNDKAFKKIVGLKTKSI